MNEELKKLVDCAIDDLFKGGLTLNSNHIQIINELAEFSAMTGKNQHVNSQVDVKMIVKMIVEET